MHTAWNNEDLSVGLCGLRWDDTLVSASRRLTLKESTTRGFHKVMTDREIAPGILNCIEARFSAELGTLESLTISGFPLFPGDADIDTWVRVVGPALDSWLATLGFTYEKSLRLQSDELVGGKLGTLGEGDYDYYRSPTGAKVRVTVLWDEPQWLAELRAPRAPDFTFDD